MNDGGGAVRGLVLLIGGAPGGKRRQPVRPEAALGLLATLPPEALLGGAIPASVLQLADPADPQLLLAHLQTAARTPGPVLVALAGQLTADRRRKELHLALAQTTRDNARYTALPWAWLGDQLRQRPAGTTTVLADLVADPEAWSVLQERGPEALTGGLPLLGQVSPPGTSGDGYAPPYTRALVDHLRRTPPGTRPADLHHLAGHSGLPPGALLLTTEFPPTAPTPAGPAALPPAPPAEASPALGPAPDPAVPVPPAAGPGVALPGTFAAARLTPAAQTTPAPVGQSPLAPSPAAAAPGGGLPPSPAAPMPPVRVPVATPAAPAPAVPAPLGPVPAVPVRPMAAPPIPVPAVPLPARQEPSEQHERVAGPGPGTDAALSVAGDPRPGIAGALHAGDLPRAAYLIADWERQLLRYQGPRAPQLADVAEAQAQLALAGGELGQATERLVEAARLRMQQLPPQAPELAMAVDNAVAIWGRLPRETALRHSAALLTLCRAIPSADGSRVRDVEARLAQLTERTGLLRRAR